MANEQIDIDYEIEFRQWYEDNVSDDDKQLKANMYRPLYVAWLAGASFSCERMATIHKRAVSG